ncbi:MAG: hypothetical protein AMXMBFR84_01040 [Candidatus Hydrogenedentota bacterium]
MDVFPALDPIPLPAPVWVFKGLHTATLALHFLAVHFLVGGLMLATWWSLRGRLQRDPMMLTASGLVVHRLPLVMTFVINLGVPPLLFTQVLYGRAFYTGSVLIGFWWLSVVPFAIIGYTMLYIMEKMAAGRRFTAWVGLIAIVVVLKVGMIFSRTMTLMLQPEGWNDMYRSSALGMHFGATSDMWARWSFMTLAAVGVTGIALMLMALKSGITPDVATFLRKRGGWVLAVFSGVQLILAVWVLQTQPAPVREALMASTGYKIIAGLWALSAVGLIAMGLWSVRSASPWLAWGALAKGFVNTVLLVLFRDGIRDVTLTQAGFNVWDQPVVTNWSTVGLFLILFVAAVAIVLWMSWVMLRAKPAEERYA